LSNPIHHDPDLLLRLAVAAEAVKRLAEQLTTLSAVAPVDQLEQLTEEYVAAQRELVALTDQWLSAQKR
jgi:hypothetical protein